jgi:Ca2+-binding RTX toxin-like protein
VGETLEKWENPAPLVNWTLTRGIRRIALIGVLAATCLIGPAAANAATLTSAGSVIYYIADQGERNDVVVGTSTAFGGTVHIYTFTDADANPIKIGGGPCELVNGVGQCRQSGITTMYINVRDRDDTAQIATAGEGGQQPPLLLSTVIGGRGNDILMGGFGPDILKGNNGRDSLRGRQGADVYKGGRGSDTLQTLDGARDTFISCGDGRRDLVRADKKDPKPKGCELGGRKPGKRF